MTPFHMTLTLSESLEQTVHGKMRFHGGCDGGVIDVRPRGLGICLAAEGEKYGNAEDHQHVENTNHKSSPSAYVNFLDVR
jgi:hypothetical protein